MFLKDSIVKYQDKTKALSNFERYLKEGFVFFKFKCLVEFDVICRYSKGGVIYL